MAVVGIVLGVTASAAAEPILRLVTFTVADPSKQDQVFQLVRDANTLFVVAKGFQSFTFSYDPATGQNVGVSLWDSQAAVEAATQTDALKALLEKLKPLTKGDFMAKTYQVHELKK
jgi:quinol monooxygenase YgiN